MAGRDAEDGREVGGVLTLPFLFLPPGAEAPGAWRAAHPDVVSLPARLVSEPGGAVTGKGAKVATG